MTRSVPITSFSSSRCYHYEQKVKAEIYWPRIIGDIQKIQDSCYDYNLTAPTQAKLTLFDPTIPSNPFEELACDYLLLPQAISHAGRKIFESNREYQIRDRLHYIYVKFPATEDQSSLQRTRNYFPNIGGMHHQNSTSCSPSSSGRTEGTVKSVKQLLRNTIFANDILDMGQDDTCLTDAS